MLSPILSPRALSRATLQRQMLLERAPMAVPDALHHLVGMQAQAPDAPYVGLWTRLAGFEPVDLARLVETRQAVRMWLMRATVHLVTAEDALRLRPRLQPVLERQFAGSPFARNVVDLDLAEVLAAGRALLEERPRTRGELRAALSERWPHHDPDSLAYVVTYHLPGVQIPPRAVWGRRGPAVLTTLDVWLADHEAVPALTPEDLVVRYLGAFGPASVKDVQLWSGLTRLREAVDELGPALQRFRGEDGGELLDLPDAPRPDPDTPAPPRFLPEYDNVLLSHADRRRIIDDGRRVPLPPGYGAAVGTVLVDGWLRATWKVVRDAGGGTATLVVEPFVPLAPADAAAVTEEGAGLLDLVAPGLAHDVVVTA